MKFNEEAVDEATNMLQNAEKINNNIKGFEPDMQAETERKKHVSIYYLHALSLYYYNTKSVIHI